MIRVRVRVRVRFRVSPSPSPSPSPNPSQASQLPGVQEAVLPVTGTVCIVYLLLRQEPDTPPTTMTDVSTTFMGIWYLGLGFGLGIELGLGSGLANPNP